MHVVGMDSGYRSGVDEKKTQMSGTERRKGLELKDAKDWNRKTQMCETGGRKGLGTGTVKRRGLEMKDAKNWNRKTQIFETGR